MKKALIVLCLLCLGLPGPSSAGQLLEFLQKALSGINTIQGRFTQKNIYSTGDRALYYEGSFILRRPSLLRWQYLKGSDDLIVVNQNTVYLYQPQYSQVFVYPERDFRKILPLWILWQSAPETREFAYTEHSDSIVFTPRDSTYPLAWIELKIDRTKKPVPVEELSFEDRYGNRVYIKLLDIQSIKDVSEDLFRFKIPEGTTVIREGL